MASLRAEGKEDVWILIRFDICFPADLFWSIAAVFIFSSTGEQPILNTSHFQNMFIVVSSIPSVAIFLAPGNQTQFISLLSRAQREPHYRRVQNSESATRTGLFHQLYTIYFQPINLHQSSIFTLSCTAEAVENMKQEVKNDFLDIL